MTLTWNVYKQSTLLPGSIVIILLFCVLPVVWVRVVLKFGKTDSGAWRFDYLSGSHLQSQVKSHRHTIYGSGRGVDWSVLSWCQNVKVAMIGHRCFITFYVSIVCWGMSISLVICKVLAVVGIGLDVLVLGFCTRFLMSVVVGSLCCKWHIQQSSSRFCV